MQMRLRTGIRVRGPDVAKHLALVLARLCCDLSEQSLPEAVVAAEHAARVQRVEDALEGADSSSAGASVTTSRSRSLPGCRRRAP